MHVSLMPVLVQMPLMRSFHMRGAIHRTQFCYDVHEAEATLLLLALRADARLGML